MNTKINKIFSIVVTGIFLLCAQTFAQRVVQVNQGVGTLNDAIDSDTTQTGERIDPNTIYELVDDGGLYLLTGSVENSGYHLTIRAAEGLSKRPILQPAVETGGASSRAFRVRGDVTLQGLYITDLDEQGGTNKNIIRCSADSIRVVIDNCKLDYDTQSALRLDDPWMTVIITNSVISNIGKMSSPDNGRGVDDRGNDIDTLIFENNTFYNITSRILRDGGGIINYAKIDHNTIADIAQHGCSIGEAVEVYYTNNLVINNGFLGRVQSSTTPVVEISPLGADLVQQGMVQKVSIENNNFWIDPQLVAVQPDTIDEVTVFDSTTAVLVDSFNTNQNSLNEEIVFTSAPALPTQVITDSWDVNVAEKTDMDEGTDPFGTTPFDFSYATSTESYSYASGGQPLGDLSWFGMVVGVKDQQNTALPGNYKLFQNYPNPFNPTTTISYQIANESNVKLTVYNSLGQLVKTLVSTNQPAGNYSVSWDGTNNFGSRVASGIYFYRLNTNQFLSVKKMIMLK